MSTTSIRILYCLLSVFWAISSHAQPYAMEATAPEQQVVEGTLLSIDLGLSNLSESDFQGYWEVKAPQGLSTISPERIPVEVQRGKKRFMTLRFKVNQIAGMQGQAVRFILHQNDGTEVLSKSVRLNVPEKRHLTLQNHSEIQFFKQVGDSIRIRIQVNNNGSTDEDIRLVLSTPDRIGKREFQIIPIQLPAGADSLIQYSFVVEKYMMNLPQYNLHVAGIYANDDVFGNLTLSFNNLTSSRNYQNLSAIPIQSLSYNRNYVELMMTNALSQNPNYYLRSQGSYWAAHGKLNYQLNINQFGNFHNSPNINNTFLQYERNNTEITLGNIQENTEASVFGRGVKLSFKDTANFNQYTVGVVEKSADLLGLYNGAVSPGVTAYLRTQLAQEHPESKSYDGLLYYDYSAFDSTTNLLFSNRFDILGKQQSERTRLQGFVAGGVAYYNSNQNSISQPSAALGLKLNTQLGKWLFDSDNFYSSPYFTGNRRGMLQFVQRISRRFNSTNLSAGYQYFNFSPKFVNPRFQPMDNSNERIDVTVFHPLSRLLSLTLQPNYQRESGTFIYGTESAQVSKQAWQLGSIINFRSPNLKHSLFANTEVGFVNLVGAPSNNFALRTNMTYNWGAWNVYGSYQTGTFQIYELYNSLFFHIPLCDRYTLGSSYLGHLFQQRLQWSSQLMGNLSKSFGNSYGGNLNLNWRLPRNTIATAHFQYTLTEGITGYRYSYNNLQLGVRQNLRSQPMDKQPVKEGDIHVFCFYDTNHNGRYDEGDQPAPAYTLLINNVMFNTDKKGNVTFKKVPYGQYQVFSPLRDNYQAVSQTITVASRKVQIQVPLQQVGTLRGKVLIQYDPARSMEADLSLSNYAIIARNQEGQLFHTHTNEFGEYSLKLPSGDYDIYLDETKLAQHIFIQHNIRPVRIEIGKVHDISPFELEVKAKQAEVKRFGT
ncbi:hypothetical protein [Sphingobacterium wenxiniae]|uniref:SD-repeat containing protein B domain-containing protein n=1 Tax=Sphingobacterium wenxiniae TaxID=683125 RepID=A0A1I6R8S4_9SPHI|nr:hypothetical protein [Sphingobacterium wenxiniae]SFS61101.1 hypothetical protein SAMN05660206_103208 [Sphingobacterium wenxiniae]